MSKASLLDLSDELLAHICGYAMMHHTPSTDTKKLFQYPPGIIADQISKKFRGLLQPFRCCVRLYKIAKHQFLEANVVILSLSDLRMSASRLEAPPPPAQMIMTGNPDPLLRNLCHVQLSVSVSDMRAPFSQPFASTSSGTLWKSSSDVLSLKHERENLERLRRLCPNLKTLHLFLKVDEWVLHGKGPELRHLDDQDMSETGIRYRRLAEALIQMIREVSVRVITVAFHHWSGDKEILALENKEAEDVLDAILMPTVDQTWEGPIARIH